MKEPAIIEGGGRPCMSCIVDYEWGRGLPEWLDRESRDDEARSRWR